MKFTVDGDHVCITRDDFINLQESPAVFYPLESDIAKILLKDGVLGLPIGKMREINDKLKLDEER